MCPNSTHLIELAKTLESASTWARHCASDIDAGREPKLGQLREHLAAVGEAVKEMGGE